MTKHKSIIILFFLSIFLCSCVKIYLRLTGVKRTRVVNKEVLSTYFLKEGIKTDEILEVDSTEYGKLISQKLKDTSVYKEPNWWVQNHIQPAQVIYFDRLTNKPVASYFNCIAEGRWFFNFTWNKDNELEFFPPKFYTQDRWIDTLFSVNEIVNTFNDFSGKKFVYKDNGKRYLALVFYTLFIEKQSTNIIREANYHINQCIKDSCQILYVNMDNFMYNQMKQ